jgi:hypothetical protein
MTTSHELTAPRWTTLTMVVLVALSIVTSAVLSAHGVSSRDGRFLQALNGPAIVPLMYLGAKHMVTGYDHLLFLVGVVFFLYKTRDVLIYVSLFTVGHSITLLAGAIGGIRADPHVVDAIIGLSIVYKAFENLGGFVRAGALEARSRHQHRQLQRRRRDRSDAGAGRGHRRAHLVAHAQRVPAARVPDQRRADDRRLRARRLSAHRTVPGATMIPDALPDPPSIRRLVTTTVLALVVAAGILITIVLPAEYGLDPFGTGAALGLTRMSAPVQPSGDVVPATPGQPQVPAPMGPIAYYPATYKIDSTQLVLGPYEFLEYKYRLEKGATMAFSWTGDAVVVHDFHGDPDNGAADAAVSYDKQNRRAAAGTFSAPFSGIHGWYWENPGGGTVTITLASAGFYTAAVEFRSDRTRRVHELKDVPVAGNQPH